MNPVVWEQMRPRLVSLAYRITGSRAEAEDIAHEAALRWLASDRSQIRSPEGFLTTVATRLSLNHLRDRKARREDAPGDWLPEPIDTSEAGREERLGEISFGFLTLLERLTPLQRAVFILRSAFDCEYGEIAAIVQCDEVACRKTFSRARTAVLQARPARPVARRVHETLLAEFLQAAGSGDASRLARLLAEDVVMRGDGGPDAPALKRPLHGRDAVARFILASRALLPAGTVLSVGELNGAPAALFHGGGHRVLALLIECGRDDLIGRVFAISDPAKLNVPAGSRHPAGSPGA